MIDPGNDDFSDFDVIKPYEFVAKELKPSHPSSNNKVKNLVKETENSFNFQRHEKTYIF